MSLGLMLELESESDDSVTGSSGPICVVIAGPVPRAVFIDTSDGDVNDAAWGGPKAVFVDIGDGAPDGPAGWLRYIVSEAAREAACDGILTAVGTPLLLVSLIFRDWLSGDGFIELFLPWRDWPLWGLDASSERLGLELKMLIPLSMLASSIVLIWWIGCCWFVAVSIRATQDSTCYIYMRES